MCFAHLEPDGQTAPPRWRLGLRRLFRSRSQQPLPKDVLTFGSNSSPSVLPPQAFLGHKLYRRRLLQRLLGSLWLGRLLGQPCDCSKPFCSSAAHERISFWKCIATARYEEPISSDPAEHVEPPFERSCGFPCDAACMAKGQPHTRCTRRGLERSSGERGPAGAILDSYYTPPPEITSEI